MSEQPPSIESEIEDHKTDLDKWIVSVETIPSPGQRQNVHERFVRDCRLLKEDMDVSDTPTAADLVDFTDRHNSLEIQYHQLTSDLNG